jgi:uncharacterized protein (TIGR02300 family)
MAKPELGTKRVCVSCGTKFYDLTKVPAICPKCGAEQPPDVPRTRRSSGNVVEDKRPKKVAPVADDADVDVEVEVEAAEDDAEEDVLEDAADLEDDADAIVPEIEPDADEPER